MRCMFDNYTASVMLVRKERLELSRVAPLEPKSSASTNSATFATLFGLALLITKYKPGQSTSSYNFRRFN